MEWLEMADWSNEQRFLLYPGDGEQSFLSIAHDLIEIENHPDWFEGEIRGQAARLFQVTSSMHSDELIALTSKSLLPIRENLKRSGIANVVVHRVSPARAEGEVRHYAAIGMSALKLI
jgi:hypothetical protein|tara:strand:- start:63 stop:416 length:354 start_codon:yes stop_codon:yes gene_type:complete